MALSINEESLRLFVLTANVDRLRPFADVAMRLGLRPSTQVFLPLTESEARRSDYSCNVRSLCEWLEDVHFDDQWLVGVALATIAARIPSLITTTPAEYCYTFARRRAELTGVRFASSSNPQYRAIALGDEENLDDNDSPDAECVSEDEGDSHDPDSGDSVPELEAADTDQSEDQDDSPLHAESE